MDLLLPNAKAPNLKKVRSPTKRVFISREPEFEGFCCGRGTRCFGGRLPHEGLSNLPSQSVLPSLKSGRMQNLFLWSGVVTLPCLFLYAQHVMSSPPPVSRCRKMYAYSPSCLSSPHRNCRRHQSLDVPAEVRFVETLLLSGERCGAVSHKPSIKPLSGPMLRALVRSLALDEIRSFPVL